MIINAAYDLSYMFQEYIFRRVYMFNQICMQYMLELYFHKVFVKIRGTVL